MTDRDEIERVANAISNKVRREATMLLDSSNVEQEYRALYIFAVLLASKEYSERGEFHEAIINGGIPAHIAESAATILIRGDGEGGDLGEKYYGNATGLFIDAVDRTEVQDLVVRHLFAHFAEECATMGDFGVYDGLINELCGAQNTTHPDIAKMAVGLIDISPRDKVFIPFSGTGTIPATVMKSRRESGYADKTGELVTVLEDQYIYLLSMCALVLRGEYTVAHIGDDFKKNVVDTNYRADKVIAQIPQGESGNVLKHAQNYLNILKPGGKLALVLTDKMSDIVCGNIDVLTAQHTWSEVVTLDNSGLLLDGKEYEDIMIFTAHQPHGDEDPKYTAMKQGWNSLIS